MTSIKIVITLNVTTITSKNIGRNGRMCVVSFIKKYNSDKIIIQTFYSPFLSKSHVAIYETFTIHKSSRMGPIS